MTGRRIDIPGAFNVRDLGGLPTTDGGATRWGRFVRSDLLAGLPDEAQERLFAYGVRIVVDLRATTETVQRPCSLANDARFEYRRIDLEGDGPIPGYDFSNEDRPLADSYAVLLASRRPAVRDVFAALASSSRSSTRNPPPPSFPRRRESIPDMVRHHNPGSSPTRRPSILGGESRSTVFFCAGGTDRTGVIAALLLGLSGVPEEAIAEDYSLSAQGLEQRFFANGPPSWMSPTDLASGRAVATLALRDTMVELLQRVRRDYGGVTSYLWSAGVTAGEVDELRNSFIE